MQPPRKGELTPCESLRDSGARGGGQGWTGTGRTGQASTSAQRVREGSPFSLQRFGLCPISPALLGRLRRANPAQPPRKPRAASPAPSPRCHEGKRLLAPPNSGLPADVLRAGGVGSVSWTRRGALRLKIGSSAPRFRKARRCRRAAGASAAPRRVPAAFFFVVFSLI